MKQRISALDLQLLGKELKISLESYRLNNIYNISDSSRQFLLKFNKPDSKLNVVVDCGLRIHITDFNRPIPPIPSGFVVKLRKHLKAKRLTALKQVTDDRILVLQFADGLYYLVLEFFSAGNVILLDEDRRILSLQRIVREHENKVGEVYKMFDETLFATNEPEKVLHETTPYTDELLTEWIKQEKADYNTRINSQIIKSNQKSRKPKVASIHKLLLRKKPHLSSDLLSKNLKFAAISPSESSLNFLGKEHLITDILKKSEQEYQEIINNFTKEGYILTRKNENYNSEKDIADLEYIYENFHPFMPYIDSKESEEWHVIKVDGEYNKTVDKFFSTIESTKYALRIQNQEQSAKQRIEQARLDNQKKIDALAEVQEINELKGNLIITHASIVEEAKFAVQGIIDQQTDWNVIEKLIQSEKKKGNEIAQIIQLPLKLKSNEMNIRLPLLNNEEESSDHYNSSDSDNSSSDDDSDFDNMSDSEDEQDTKPTKNKKKNVDNNKYVTITIDLGLSAYANASKYFNAKKSNAEKQKKVEKNIEKAMKNIETKIDQQLKKKLKESHTTLKQIRSQYFFEKYFWFFSTEGFLVLMGKSPVETDQIYSKYIEDNDVYMTNNYNTQVWIKNPENTEIPPNTLMQAGIFCMSSSDAWQKKVAASPRWCLAKNISKFRPRQEEALEPGIFYIKDEKEEITLPAAQLVMGFGFLWKVKSDIPEDEDYDKSEEHEHERCVEEAMEHADQRNNEPESNELDLSPFERTEELNESETLSELNNDFSSVRIEKENITDEEEDNFDIMSTATNLVQNMNKNVRGKKGKLKKMQKKYADQDDTERLLRMEALGTLKGIEKQQQKDIEEISKERSRQYKKDRRERQKKLQTLRFSKNEKVKVNYTRFKIELRTTLTKEDEVIDIIPVFAPWPALLKYKYKVKVQPGSAKKTKSMADILHYFMNRKVDNSSSDKEEDWPIEHEMIKTIKEQELIPLLCVDKLNVSIPGQSKNGKGNSKGGNTKTRSKKRK